MRNILLILIILIPALVFPQTSRQQIKEMKEGVMLVRLKTSEKVIEGLKDAGLYDKAKEVRQEQKKENQEIAAAYHKSFDFCPVYFFYSDCSGKVREGDFKDCLMDHNLEKLKSVPEIGDNYFISEFSYVQKTDPAYFDKNIMAYDTTGYKIKQKTYYGGTELGPDAVIIMDRHFRQLRGPFPSYVRTYEGFPILRRKKPKAVAKLNEALQEYYKKTVK